MKKSFEEEEKILEDLMKQQEYGGYKTMPKEFLSNPFKTPNIDQWKKHKSNPASMNDLMSEIEKWSEKYEFSFQFWALGNNNVWIYKGGVEIFNRGGCESPREIIEETLLWIYKINRVRIDQRPILEIELTDND